MIGYIYKVTNPNGLVYIGKSKNIKNRFNQYKNLNCKSQPALHNSLSKYGFDNHILEVIEECNLDDMSNREIHYIKLYNSFSNGLNCTFGGDDGFLYGEYNVAHRPEVKEKMRQAKLEYYKHYDHPMKGKKHSIESIDKIKYRRSIQDKIIRVYVLDLDNGIFYDSIKDLSILLNIKYKTFHYRLKYTNMYNNKYLLIDVNKTD
jgi:hypothetical protein